MSIVGLCLAIIPDMVFGHQVFSFCRYDPTVSFSSEFWYDLVYSKKIAQAERKKLMLQVLYRFWAQHFVCCKMFCIEKL